MIVVVVLQQDRGAGRLGGMTTACLEFGVGAQIDGATLAWKSPSIVPASSEQLRITHG